MRNEEGTRALKWLRTRVFGCEQRSGFADAVGISAQTVGKAENHKGYYARDVEHQIRRAAAKRAETGELLLPWRDYFLYRVPTPEEELGLVAEQGRLLVKIVGAA